MKTFNLTLISLITLLVLASCSNGSNKNNPQPSSAQPQNNEQFMPNQGQPTSQNQPQQQTHNNQETKVVMKYLKDETGAKVARMPLPTNWKINPNVNDTIKIKGPNGLMMIQKDGLVFGYSEDKQTQQSIENEGMTLQPFIEINQLAGLASKQFEKSGYTILTSYPLPAYEQLLRKESAKINIPGGTLTTYCMGVEMKDSNGTSLLLTIVQTKTIIDNFMVWTLDGTRLLARTNEFESAKKTYLFALENMQINPKVIEDSNREIQAEFNQDTSN